MHKFAVNAVQQRLEVVALTGILAVEEIQELQQTISLYLRKVKQLTFSTNL